KERLTEFPHLVAALTEEEESKANDFVNDEGVMGRTWIERVLHEFQDGKIDPAGRAAVAALCSYGSFSPIDRHGSDVTAPLGAMGRRARSSCITGAALHLDDTRHRDAMGP